MAIRPLALPGAKLAIKRFSTCDTCMGLFWIGRFFQALLLQIHNGHRGWTLIWYAVKLLIVLLVFRFHNDCKSAWPAAQLVCAIGYLVSVILFIMFDQQKPITQLRAEEALRLTILCSLLRQRSSSLDMVRSLMSNLILCTLAKCSKKRCLADELFLWANRAQVKLSLSSSVDSSIMGCCRRRMGPTKEDCLT